MPPIGNTGLRQPRNQLQEGGGASPTPKPGLPVQAEPHGARSKNPSWRTGAGGGEGPMETRTRLTTRS